MITIGLADDEPLFATGLALILNSQPDMRVLWQAPDGADAILQQHAEPADVILLDIQMPGTDGLAATQSLVANHAGGDIIILTTFDTNEYVLAAVEAGAAGFLLKNTPPDDLIDAIRTVHQGNAVISPGPTRRLFATFRRDPQTPSANSALTREERQVAASLTTREREVLTLITQGLTNQEICDQLWLSMPTIKTHISNLIAKTQCRDRVHLVLFALRSETLRNALG